jgi:segregation and condensation protein A
MTHAVQTPVFEGPFDLLLHLILREQVDLYEIRLATIVDAYLAEVARLPRTDLEGATEFLLIAATLAELKSRRLLPGDGDLEIDEELSLWQERDVLLARLLECKTFKDAAAALDRLADLADRSAPRRTGPDERFIGLLPDLLAGVEPADLRTACLRALAPKPVPRIDLDHVAPIRASVTDSVAELLDELPQAGRITFRRLCGALVERLEVIVRFLAVLELFKQGLVELEQAVTFGEIEIVWLGDPDVEAARRTDLVAATDAYDG